MEKQKKLLRSRINLETREGFPPVWKWCQGWTLEELSANEEKRRQQYAAHQLRLPAKRSAQPKAEGAPKFRAVAEEWLSVYKAPRLRANTLRMYRSILEHQIYPAIGDLPVDRITRKDIQGLFNALNGMSKSTIRKAKLTLAQIFDSAQEDELIARTPMRRVSLPDGAQKTVRPVDPQKVQSLTAHCLADPDGLLPLLLIYSGLRRGEALALTWADIGETEIRVDKCVTYIGNKPTLGQPKTAAGVRAVPLLPVVREKLPPRSAPDAYLFGGSAPLTSTAFRNLWNRLQRNIPELRGVHPHMLRHTYTDILRHAGVDILAAQHLLGHEDYQTTANFYSAFDEVDRKDAENRLLQFVSHSNPPLTDLTRTP